MATKANAAAGAHCAVKNKSVTYYFTSRVKQETLKSHRLAELLENRIDPLVGFCGDESGEQWRLGANFFVRNGMPDRQDYFGSGHFLRQESVEFMLGPIFRKEICT